jgi:pantoate--beta-alanine ligase
MQEISLAHKINKKSIGVVPTMGYLHEGHLSLIDIAKEKSDIVITTLFVNPTQFGANEDFHNYPRDVERDKELAQEHGCDILFAPEMQEVYPDNFKAQVIINDLTTKFEGATRPGHFNGVALIVSKLFNITLPDIAVFGQKDLQQTLVIKKMIDDLNFPVEMIIAPIIRESNGLAMSSRNKYLTSENRQKAGIIFRALEDALHVILRGERERKTINAYMLKTLRSIQEIKIDYACAVLADTLEEPVSFHYGDEVALIIAVYLGKTRLIDNMLIKIPANDAEKSFIEGI